MIGGYLYRRVDEDIERRLLKLSSSFKEISAWDMGRFFFSNPYQDDHVLSAVRPDMIACSEDLLVGWDGNISYRELELDSDFLDTFRKDESKALDSIQCDCRMAVACRTREDCTLFLVSHRAGSGRMYYHRLAEGILFSSDLRFLLGILPLEVNPLGIYSLLKYGSVIEPLTISRNISAVPVAHYAEFDLNRGKDSFHPFFKFRFDCETNTPGSPLNSVEDVLKQSAAFLGDYPAAMLLSGGIDSSLYGCYLNQVRRQPVKAFYCAFGTDDPEWRYAKEIANRLSLDLKTAAMGKSDALQALDDAAQLTDHPFSDFSSLPVVFLLKFIRQHLEKQGVVIECNGGDDCFGFPDLQNESKYRLKHFAPSALKKVVSAYFRNSPYWKWVDFEGSLARLAAMADVHESTPLNYFLVLAPINYLALEIPREWNETLQNLIEETCSRCAENYNQLSFEAKITIRQLLFVNSARWASKALSVGESLGLRVMYPYIWRDVLQIQGTIPWETKVRQGVVKWPLKKLLESFMPEDFIYRKKSGFVPPLVNWLTDPEFNNRVRETVTRSNGFVTQILPVRMLNELLEDAFSGKRLRHPVMNTLWGAIFCESWIREHSRH